jgi:hypothetical protein
MRGSLFRFNVLALLIGDGAGGLAGGLAGSLALAAAGLRSFLRKCFFVESFDVFHFINTFR